MPRAGSGRTTRVLIAGTPRSGSTWLARELCRGGRTVSILEPDNPEMFPAAAAVRDRLGAWPLLAASDEDPGYARLWSAAFRGRPLGPPAATGPGAGVNAAMPRTLRALLRPPAFVVVKSVFVSLSLEWVWGRFQPSVVVVERPPLSVVSSWIRRGFGAEELAANVATRERLHARLDVPGWDPHWPYPAKVAWTVGTLMTAQAAALQRHPEWLRLSHEQLLADRASVNALARRLGLPASDTTSADPPARRRDPGDSRSDAAGLAAAAEVLDLFPALH